MFFNLSKTLPGVTDFFNMTKLIIASRIKAKIFIKKLKIKTSFFRKGIVKDHEY